MTARHLPNFVFLAFCFFISKPAHAGIEIYGGMHVGGNAFNESSGGAEYKHSSTFFVGHWGLGLGGRAKISLGNLGVGAIGELSWIGDSIERKQSGVVNDATYRDESFRHIAGLTTSFKLGIFSLIGEYYPLVQNTISYSDSKSENPFRKSDKLKGTGYGVGFAINLVAGLNIFTIYKNLEYKDVEMNSVSVTLPSAQYSSLKVEDVMFGAGYEF